MSFLIGFFVFMLGLCVGSFLNCVIYRLENNKKVTGRSFCPQCKHNLKWSDLFPVMSFAFLGGKCRYCKKKISCQYPLVELATAIVFLLVWFFVPASWVFLCLMLYISSSMILIFVYDLRHYEIPDIVLFPTIIIALIYRLINFNQLLSYLGAILVVAGFFFIIWAVSRGKWMGFGDVKFAILMGLLLGFSNVLVALFLAFFFGAIIGVILMIGKKKGLKSEIPFGPFLILGTFISLFWGQQIVQWYLNLIKV